MRTKKKLYKKKTRNDKRYYKKKTNKTSKTKQKRIVKITDGTNKYNKSIKKINGVNCAPKNPNEINEYSCYSKESLFKLRDLWNARHTDIKIKTNNPTLIHSKLKKYLQNVCDTEKCWLKQNTYFGKISDELKESFAPTYPTSWLKNKYEWLNSHDIMKVMYQFEQAYPNFRFIGPSPIDFDKKINENGKCVWDELCNFDLDNLLSKNINQIGIIFNTDPHTKGGRHWISLYIDILEKKILYFDSGGSIMPREIQIFIDRVISQGKELKPTIKFEFDTTTGIHHQLEDSECGVYSLFFIINMLEENVDKNYLKHNLFRDKYINQFREIYFNRPK